MLKKIFAFKFLILTICALQSPTWALDFQLGVGALDISKSDETTKESTFFPFVGLGFGMNSGLSVVLEVGTLGYETNVTGDEDLAKGSLSTTGTSTALIIAPQTENFVFRLGYGTILYKYNFEMDSGWDSAYELFGWDVTQKLDDAKDRKSVV